jgi:hypothetical protein
MQSRTDWLSAEHHRIPEFVHAIRLSRECQPGAGARDNPKDSYDFCHCIERFSEGMEKLAEDWKQRMLA